MNDLVSENQEKLLTLLEAASYFQVSTYTIKRWLITGKLKGSRLPGNQWRVFKSSCDALIEKGRN